MRPEPGPWDSVRIRVPRKTMAHLQHVMESYDNIAWVRTLDKRAGVLEIAFPAPCREDILRILDSLREKSGWTPVEEDWL